MATEPWKDWVRWKRKEVLDAARKVGGEFVESLAETLQLADQENMRKIIRAWPNTLKQLYLYYQTYMKK